MDSPSPEAEAPIPWVWRRVGGQIAVRIKREGIWTVNFEIMQDFPG